MLPLKEFAHFVILNTADLAETYIQLLQNTGQGYEQISVDSCRASARTLLEAVAEACQAETFIPLSQLFDPDKEASQRWAGFQIFPRQPLLEVECLGQTLTPVVTSLEAGKFLWQMLAETRAVVLAAAENSSAIPEASSSESGPYTQLTGQAGQDITGRKRVEEILAKRADELQAVTRISTALSSILDSDRLLQEVADLTKSGFDLYHAHLYLLDEAGEDLVLAAGAGEVGRKMTAQGWQIPLAHEKSLVARTARTRQGVIANDVRAEPDFLPNPDLPETRSEMAVPVMAGEKLLGVLDVQSDQVGRFSEEDAQITTTLAAQAAIAIQNASLFAQTQAALADLSESQSLLRSIIDATPDWIFIKDQEHRYRLVNQGYANALHLSPEDFLGKNDLELGFPEELVKGNPQKGIRGFWADDRLVMDSGEPQVYPNDPATIDGQVHVFHTIKTPLHDAEDKIWGVLAFSRDITERETVLAKMERQARREQTIRRITEKMRQAPNLDLLAKIVAEELGKALGVSHSLVRVGAGMGVTPVTASNGKNGNGPEQAAPGPAGEGVQDV